jgi:uncharacterized protein YjiS (DUF1127 family)
MKHFLERTWAAYERYAERRATYLILDKLSERQLNDLGYSRSQLRDRLRSLSV